MLSIDAASRRAALVHRHLLDGSGADPYAVVDALLCLHATDPASVYLSVLARSAVSTIEDLQRAMYGERALVRWLAMRRTLFVFRARDVPMVQAAVSTPLAAVLRKRLLRRIELNGAEPPLEGDPDTWLARLEADVRTAVRDRGQATGAQLAADVPALRTVIPARTASEAPQRVTSSALAMASAAGDVVRGGPPAAWTSRQHRWEPVDHWFPGGVPAMDPADAETELARRWLAAFGPASPADLEWWTGWTRTTTRRALGRLRLVEVDLDGETGVVLEDDAMLDALRDAEPPGVATLLPALDPTAMGWRHRDWYLGVDPSRIFDRAGNIGPTVWWDGRIVGAWATGPDGDVRTATAGDLGGEAHRAIEEAAARLGERLAGARVVPAARTPWERELADA